MWLSRRPNVIINVLELSLKRWWPEILGFYELLLLVLLGHNSLSCLVRSRRDLWNSCSRIEIERICIDW